MQTTSNYKLKKPDGTDPVEIQDFNENADILDAELAKRAGKATATTGADGLMAAADKVKLNGITASANNYTHPSAHPPSIITQDANNRFTSDMEKLVWNNHVNSRSNPHGITPAQIGAATASEVADLKKSVSDGKKSVAAAITAKGQATAQDAAFGLMATNISKIQTGVDTSSATAVAGDILSGKTAFAKGNKLTGTIASKGAATITPSASNQTIPAGQYLSGAQTIAGDADLVSANIRAGVNIFGVAGKSSVVDTADANAATGDILAGRISYQNGNRVVGNIPNFIGVVTHIKNRRINNNRFEVAVDGGYHGCYWLGNSYEYLELNEVAATIGLSPEKLAAGNTVCGVVGTAGGKRYAAGTVKNTNEEGKNPYYWPSGNVAYFNIITVTGLSFTPKIMISNSINDLFRLWYCRTPRNVFINSNGKADMLSFTNLTDFSILGMYGSDKEEISWEAWE